MGHGSLRRRISSKSDNNLTETERWTSNTFINELCLKTLHVVS